LAPSSRLANEVIKAKAPASSSSSSSSSDTALAKRGKREAETVDKALKRRRSYSPSRDLDASRHSMGRANITQAEHLAKELEKRTVSSMFTQDGKLTEGAIKDAKFISAVKDYNPNALIYKELSTRGNPEDWRKYRTQKIHTLKPTKNIAKSKRNLTAEVHFYHNRATGAVYYDKDFKVKDDGPGNPHLPVEDFINSVPKEWRPKTP
jgi:hypothetical protein